MVKTLETSYKKATQALNFLARKKDNKINKMKAIKLIYLADRLHLRKYGRPIVGDKYWAMKYGPVGSMTKNIAELDISENVFSYAKKYIKPVAVYKDKDSFMSLSGEDLSVFSKTDIECLNAIYDEFSDKDQFELAEITHNLPEWKKYERELASGKKRVEIDYADFFAMGQKQERLFAQDKETLSSAKDFYKESETVASFFS